VLPILKEEDKNVHLKFLKYHKVAQSYYDYINSKVYEIIEDIVKDNTMNLDKFNTLDEFMKDKVLEEVIRPYYPDDLYLINDNHINEILKMINSDKPNIELVLPNNFIVKREYNKLIFNTNSSTSEEYDYELIDEVETPYGLIKLIESDDKDTSNNIIRINSKDIKFPLHVRTKKDGDKISVKNMDGSKKVSDIFIDNKVSKEVRNNYPIVVDSDNNVVFIPGIKKSKYDIPTNEEYDIIIKYVWEEKNEEN
jgi:tRNA(Ile)-lysidine synthase